MGLNKVQKRGERMKSIVAGCVALLLSLPAWPQTFSEWFRQNSTRLKYYAKQIAALRVSIGELEKEYQIANAGLGMITNGKQGELDLHNAFYASLEEVNPLMPGLDEVTEITSTQAAVLQIFTEALKRYRADGLLRADWMAYIGQVYNSVVVAEVADVKALEEVLTNSNLQMTDDQRIERIRELDRVGRDQYAFTLAFTGRMDVLERQQAMERTELATIKSLYWTP